MGLSLEVSRIVLSSLILSASICDPLMNVMMHCICMARQVSVPYVYFLSLGAVLEVERPVIHKN